VVSVVNNITCNSVNKNCFPGHDNYRNPCPDNEGAGNHVLLAHADGTYSLYAHLKSGSVRVVRNQAVRQGTYLADQGHSGSANSATRYRACGDHLHFQRQTSPAVFGKSLVTDFGEAPCALSCLTAFVSANVEKSILNTSSFSVVLSPST